MNHEKVRLPQKDEIAAKIASLQSAKKLIERIDYARLWQTCAYEVLSPEMLKAVTDLASLRHREALVSAVEDAAA